MAPYAIAHLKIGLKLFETGYRFESDERARVYLTNALEPAGDEQLMLDFLPALAHEATPISGANGSRSTAGYGSTALPTPNGCGWNQARRSICSSPSMTQERAPTTAGVQSTS